MAAAPSSPGELRIGVAGAGGRGGSFRNALHSLGATIHAVCDLDPERARASAKLLGAPRCFTDYSAMLREGGVTAVVIGTPMQLHVRQSVEALRHGIHVLCEVTAGVSIDECRELVDAVESSDAVYMLAENLNFDRSCVQLNGVVDSGRLGDVYYAEGEYLHDIKFLAERTPWRRHWQMGIRGLTYCSHALGPIMRWFHGDRIVRVCCEDAGSHYTDKKGAPFAGDAAIMLAKTAQGRLLKIRADITSSRPYGMNFQLQGTRGAVEISNSTGRWGQGRIQLDSSDEVPTSAGGGEERHWQDLGSWMQTEEARELLPLPWRSGSAEHSEATKTGHNGSDYYVTASFLSLCRGEVGTFEPIDVHTAMDMTLPGLCSQLSAAQDGAWVDVPDSRDWVRTITAVEPIATAPRPRL